MTSALSSEAAPRSAPSRRHGLALLVIAAAQLMLVLDGTITNVALPRIQQALHLAPADLNWVITAYALAFGSLLLIGGRAGDLFGRRRVFRIGLIVFAVASLIGGLAPNAEVLIGARALQGMGAAIAAPTALSLLATTFPAGPERNRAFGVYAAMGGLGGVVGLLLGGALTDYLDWRWVLFVNIPIALAILVGTNVLPAGDRGRGKIDLPGAISATAGLGALVYAINRASTVGWLNAGTIALFAVALVLLGVFLLVQRRSAVAMLPPRVLRDGARRGAFLIMFLLGAGMFGTFYFLTLFMQGVEAYSPMRTGLVYLPFAIGIGAGAGGIGPRLLGRLSERAIMVSGLLLAAVGMVWLSALTPGANPFAILLPAQLVAGIGIGLAMVTVTVRAVRGVAAEDTGVGSGLVNASQQIGGALGLAVLVVVASSVTASVPAGTAVNEALTTGYTTAFLAGGAVYLLALVVAVFSPRS